MNQSYPFSELMKDICREVQVHHGRPVWTLVTNLFSVRLQLIVLYRVSRFAALNHLGLLCPLLRWLQYLLASSEISPYSQVGRRVRMPHPTGIVVGFGTVIEDDVSLFQHVTLGARGRSSGQGGYPVIRRGATLYAGATVIGAVTVGEDAVVGAKALVLDNVPDGAVALGVPARVVVR